MKEDQPEDQNQIQPDKEQDVEIEKAKNIIKQRIKVYNESFRKKSFDLITFTGGMVVVFISLLALVFEFNKELEVPKNEILLNTILPASLGLFVMLLIYLLLLTIIKKGRSEKVSELEYLVARHESEELQDNIEDNFFTKLVQINFKYLDQYYLQTQRQADKSFVLAIAAAIVGFATIIAGIIMMFFTKLEAASITTATGVISEFIAAVFFYLYNRTVLKMSQYHQKLVITQNISLALRISEDMTGDEKTKTQKLIISRLTKDINKHLSIESLEKK